ncbi:MAG: NifU family protein [bacterium]
MVDKVKKAIEELRPFLQGDGGDIEFVAFDEKTGEVKVKLTGACNGCPMAQVTLKQGVEVKLMEDVPAVKSVVAV